MLSVSVKQQLLLLLYSFIVGAAMSALYDIVRIIRRLSVKPRQRTVLVQDIIYCITVTAVYIVFIYAANLGIPRFFSAASAAAGFMFLHFTVGEYAVTFGAEAFKLIYRIFRTVFFIIVRPLEIILSFLYKKAKAVLCKLTICKKFCKNLFIFLKKRNIIYSCISRFGKMLKRSDRSE